MSTSHDNSATFAAVLAKVLRRVDRGEPIDRDQLLAEYPRFRDQLASFLAGDGLVNQLVRPHGVAINGNYRSAVSLLGRFADFELLDEIGRGGMGVVYRARQSRPDRIVALKMVLAGRHASEKALRRFYQEAEAAARLRHPGIVSIHQVGEHDGLAYYVMDFIEGESLDDRLARGPLPPCTAAEMLLEITRAVAHAHQQGVIHRDLKPANILLESSPLDRSPLAPREETSARNSAQFQMRNGECGMRNESRREDTPALTTDHRPLTTAYIADFGLARLLDSGDNLTATGEVVGTASYMAPEQAGFISRSEMTTIHPAADIYGLGAVLYAMLTGRPPFQAASRDETIAQVKFKEPATPRSINAAVPRDLETIALKCLQKMPQRRYATAAALADDLESFLAGRPIAARPVGRLERSARWVRRNPVTASLVSLLAVSLVAGAVLGTVLSIRSNQHAADSAHHLYIAHMNLAQQYWDAGRTAPVLELLRRYIPKEGEPDQRGWEWYYQWNLCHRELRRLGEWPGGVQCVAVSPDGTQIVAGGDQGALQLFDTATGRVIARLSGHTGTIYAVAFSPDGKRLASGGADRTIRIWELSNPPLPPGEGRGEGESNNQPLAILSRHTNDIRGLSFSPDGSLLVSSSEDGNAWLWDMTTYQPLRSVSTGPARAVAFHPNGQQFVCASRDGVVHMWGIANGDKTASWPAHTDNVYGLVFNRAGSRLFSAGTDCVINCLDTSTGQEIWSVKNGASFNCLSLAGGEQTVAVGSDDQTIRLYSASTGDAKSVYRGHTGWVQGVAFLSDSSRLVSGSADGTVRLWNELCTDEGRTLRGHELQVTSLAFSPDGRAIATGDITGVIRLFDPITGLMRRRVFGPGGAVVAIAFGPHGRRGGRQSQSQPRGGSFSKETSWGV